MLWSRDLPASFPSWAMTAMKVVKKKQIFSLLIIHIFKLAYMWSNSIDEMDGKRYKHSNLNKRKQANPLSVKVLKKASSQHY